MSGVLYTILSKLLLLCKSHLTSMVLLFSILKRVPEEKPTLPSLKREGQELRGQSSRAMQGLRLFSGRLHGEAEESGEHRRARTVAQPCAMWALLAALSRTSVEGEVETA